MKENQHKNFSEKTPEFLKTLEKIGKMSSDFKKICVLFLQKREENFVIWKEYRRVHPKTRNGYLIA